MAARVAAGIPSNEARPRERRPDGYDVAFAHQNLPAAFAHFLSTGRCGRDAGRDAVTEFLRHRRIGREGDVEKKQRLHARSERSGRLALTSGLQAAGDRGPIEPRQHGVTGQNLGALDHGRSARKVGDEELVDQVGIAVRATERHRRGLDRENERREHRAFARHSGRRKEDRCQDRGGEGECGAFHRRGRRRDRRVRRVGMLGHGALLPCGCRSLF